MLYTDVIKSYKFGGEIWAAVGLGGTTVVGGGETTTGVDGTVVDGGETMTGVDGTVVGGGETTTGVGGTVVGGGETTTGVGGGRGIEMLMDGKTLPANSPS